MAFHDLRFLKFLIIFQMPIILIQTIVESIGDIASFFFFMQLLAKYEDPICFANDLFITFFLPLSAAAEATFSLPSLL